MILFSHHPRLAFPSELKYITNLPNGSVSGPKLLPLQAEDDIELSVVIPCYNEIDRLAVLLQELVEYLELEKLKYELLIVDDGSKDGTAEYLLQLAHDQLHLDQGTMRVVKFEQNRGKGGAVTHGMKFVRGQYAIFIDADGASKFSDISKLLLEIKKLDRGRPFENGAVLIGSRLHMINTDAVVKRSLIRNFLMYSLHTLVFIFGIRDIKDTQCGFKLFNYKAIQEIFPQMHTEGWIFDVEVLILAIRKKIPIKECAISWHEVDGSKVDLARDSIAMAIDLVTTRLAYLIGVYKDNK